MKSSGKILIVDDEIQIRKFLEVSLSAQGYSISQAGTGTDALTQAIALRPDLIILDLALPDTDGLSVLKKLREWTPTPVIVLTAKDSTTDKVALLDAGADDYLTKPFNVPELLARVRTALRHGSPIKDGSKFISGDLEVDLEGRVAKLNSKEVKLTATEFDLLKVLIRYSGKVITQRQMLKEVWGPNAVEHSHYLRIYVAQLRKKLSPEDLYSLIVTEPGVGYRLKV